MRTTNKGDEMSATYRIVAIKKNGKRIETSCGLTMTEATEWVKVIAAVNSDLRYEIEAE